MSRDVKDIRKDLEDEALIIKSNNPPALVVIHLEKAIRLYNELYAIEKPSMSDKAGFMLLKSQYRVLCAVTRRKQDKKILDGEY